MSMTIGHVATRATLPSVLTSILGRDRESSTLREMLADADCRLVTILGPGGVGTTRLAIHVAANGVDAGREVLFVSAAAMRDPALVLQAIGHAAGASGEAPAEAMPWVVEAVQDRDLLLVLDNLEQVPGVAADLARLLEECPLLTILATSRAPLEIDGEVRFRLAPLDLPDADVSAGEILDTDAVTLFVNRARAANPNLAPDDHASTIGAICRRLDGLPLAIELAAVRTTILPPEALLARLEGSLQVLGGTRQDVPDRQRTMRETIAWSYELLEQDEQLLFRYLGVFAGGSGADAVAHVGAAIGVGDPGAIIATLVNQSLVREVASFGGEVRFHMLETVRSYALEQLAACGETDAAFLTMADYLGALAETAEPHLRGARQRWWLDRLDIEAANLRVAVEWALANGQADAVFRIASGAEMFIQDRGLVREARGWLERAFAVPGGHLSPLRARAVTVAGYLEGSVAELATARPRFEQALQLARAIGDRLEECRALIGLGRTAVPGSEFALAEELLRQAIAIAREENFRYELAMALNGLGIALGNAGRPEEGVRCLEEARSVLAESGDRIFIARIAMNLGFLCMGLGELDRAEELIREALGVQRDMNARGQLGVSLVNWAGLALHKGNIKDAHAAYSEAISLFRERGNRAYEGGTLTGFANVAYDQGDYPEAASRLLEANRLLASTGDNRQVLENAETLAGVCTAAGHPELAVELLAVSAHIRDRIGAPADPFRQDELDQAAAAARDVVGKTQFEETWQASRLPDIDALVRRVSTIAREVMGTQHASPEVAAVEPVLDADDAAPGLTPRETEILTLLSGGRSTNAIAKDLDVRPRTVATHIANILVKLEVSNRTAAVAWAMRSGIV